MCSRYNSHFYHISTDCVFDGQKGPYDESSIPSSVDNYGKSKTLGEVLNSENAATIRTSIIGPEVSNHKTGLFEWVRSLKEDKVKGYANVYWSGVTTVQLAMFLKTLIVDETRFIGLIHYGNGKCISKFDLLQLINKEFNLCKTIVPVDRPKYNKHLLVREKIAELVPDYAEMIKEMSEWIKEKGHIYDPKN